MSDLTVDARMNFKEKSYKTKLKTNPKILLTTNRYLGMTNQILLLDLTLIQESKSNKVNFTKTADYSK